jgi:hypothetical protein
MLSAIPVIPKSAPVAAGNRNGSGLSVNSNLLVGLVAGAVIAAAIIALTPSSGNANGGDADPVPFVQHNFISCQVIAGNSFCH